MNEISEQTLGQMQKLARRLKTNIGYMAWVIESYKKQEQFTDQQMSEHLRTSTIMYTRLALCKRPVSNSPDFGSQVRQIADYTQTDPAQIAQMLRQVDSIQALSQMPNQIVEENSTATFRSGLLAAARDREQEPPTTKPIDNDKASTDETEGGNDVPGQ